jgi:RNA polymerase sigma-70 factor, ECF subfamily
MGRPVDRPTGAPGARSCEPAIDGSDARRQGGGNVSVDDEQLVARAQAGDRVAFEELVRRHADRLHAVVLRLAGDRHEAEEVTQEAFLRAWRGIRDFKGDARFFTWLYRIGVNEARRRAQRRPSAGAVTSLEAQAIEPRDRGPGPERAVEQTDLRAALEAAVRDLDPDYRAPLVLRDIEGLSTAEAAAIIGLGEAALKSRLHRARLAVRAAVDSYLPDHEET